jgi:hypothetical protein
MDAKTVLLLGIGMVVLSLLGYCVAPSRSANLFPARPLRQELPRGLSLRMDLAKRHAALAGPLARYRALHVHVPATCGSQRFRPAEHNVASLRS